MGAGHEDDSGVSVARPTRRWVKLLGIGMLCALWILLSRIPSVRSWLLGELEHVREMGVWGFGVFALLYIPMCLACFPDALTNAAAGAVWGVGFGTLAVSLGRVLGASAAFEVARVLTRRWRERRTTGDPKFAVLTRALRREGFKIVLLIRLCPIFPVNVSHFGLGVTPVSLRAYALGTLIGLVPRTVLVCYAGSGAQSLIGSAATPEATPPVQQALFWAGFVFTVLIVAIIARMAHRMLREAAKAA
ncbi:MAG TPA: TVP38/TMEM64 family protein [Candidatus Hydrogenedentes bacterium]|nr:TVP38/TMEM64 family protein [Candidatus Hydrogenedentota bacterium]